MTCTAGRLEKVLTSQFVGCTGLLGRESPPSCRLYAGHCRTRVGLEDLSFLNEATRLEGNSKGLFTTLSSQLAFNNHHLKPLISQSVEDDSPVVGLQTGIQLRNLILEPCQSVTNLTPQILLLDGLDECQDQGTQLEILRLIACAVQGNPRMLRFLIASRPEVHIRNSFHEPSFLGIFKSVNVEQSFEDIRTYFRDEFARIHREHRDTMGSIPSPWPSYASDVLDILVENSSGYFVFASFTRPQSSNSSMTNIPVQPTSWRLF
jgi:hypothetical protein